MRLVQPIYDRHKDVEKLIQEDQLCKALNGKEDCPRCELWTKPADFSACVICAVENEFLSILNSGGARP